MSHWRFLALSAFFAVQTHSHAATVEFRGNELLADSTLSENVAEQIIQIESEGLTPARADDLTYFTGLTYRDNGFLAPTVTPQTSGDTLTLHINEGPRTELVATPIKGATAYSETKLEDYILGPTRENVTGDDLPYVPAQLSAGLANLRGLYLSDGYLDVEIDEPRITFNVPRTEARATITIREGKPYTFGPITILGSTAVPAETIREAIADLITQPYSEARVRLIEERIAYEFQKAGYYEARVSRSGDLQSPTQPKGEASNLPTSHQSPVTNHQLQIPLTLTITPAPPFRFGQATVTGTTRLRPSFVRKRFGTLTGKLYNPDALNRIFQRQLGTGLYNQLRVRQLPTSPPPTPGTVDLAIEVEEAPSQEIGFSVGYGTFEGAGGGIRFVERNLFGTGRPLTASIEATQRTFGADLTLDDPWFLERDDLALQLRAYALTRRLEGYTKNELGFRPELTLTVTPRFTTSAFLLTKGVSIDDEGISDDLIGRTPYLANSVGLTAVYDTRDNPLNPDQGFVLGTTADAATRVLGSDVSFARITARAAYYLPIGDTLLAFGVRGGIMTPIEGDSGVPIDERFFNGGASSVRSFADRELGPHNNGYPTGGQTFTVFNLEYVIPVIDSLKAAVFVDAGSVGQSTRDFGILRTGVGAGLRYDLPIGPIRLDAALNPNPRPGEAIGAIHFTIGLAF